MITMRFLPDSPIAKNNDEALGFSDFVKDIHDAILYTQTPFVYGVLGDWGTGKTSVLHLLLDAFTTQQRNFGEPVLVPIWFDAWRYENEINIVYPLLHAIRTAYEKDPRLQNIDVDRPTFLQRFSDVAITSAFVLGDIGLRAATKTLIKEAYSLKELQEHYDKMREHEEQDALIKVLGDWADKVQQIHDAFEALLSAYADDIAQAEGVQSYEVNFVILIDDLDRCLPETTIAILEGIKNHLSVDRAVFVLGLNPQVVYQGIRHKYGNLDINGREYLEKILNYTFYMPEPTLEAVSTFATGRIQHLISKEDYQLYKEDFVTFGNILRDSFFNNPRKIKRILNRYLLFINKYDSERERQKRSQDYRNKPLRAWYGMPNIVRLLIIAEYFPDLFQLFLNKTEEALKYMRFADGEHTLKEFETHFGVLIGSIFPQLVRMHVLFSELHEQTDGNKPNLKQQAQAVFAITRLI